MILIGTTASVDSPRVSVVVAGVASTTSTEAICGGSFAVALELVAAGREHASVSQHRDTSNSVLVMWDIGGDFLAQRRKDAKAIHRLRRLGKNLRNLRIDFARVNFFYA